MKSFNNLIRKEAALITHSFHEKDTCPVKRYLLIKQWNKKGDTLRKATVFMYNPSISTEYKTDLTISKCINILHEHGYNYLEVINIFPTQAKNPKDLKPVDKVFDEENFICIKKSLKEAEIVIIAWGYEGGKKHRDKKILDLLQKYKSKLHVFFNPNFENGVNNKPPSSSSNPVHPRNISEDKATIVPFDFSQYRNR